MGVAAVFIDGGYLDKIIYHDHQNQRIDYGHLVNEMAAPDSLLRELYEICDERRELTAELVARILRPRPSRR